jgi:DNA-binding ferritin-like protein (Dps family)
VAWGLKLVRKFFEGKMKNIIESIVKTVYGSVKEKSEYKAYLKLLKSLPEDYQFVAKEIENYMFSFVLDENVMTVLMNIAEAFAVAATDGRNVFSVTGKDVGSFCNDIIKKQQLKTYEEIQREKLNKNINKKFG